MFEVLKTFPTNMRRFLAGTIIGRHELSEPQADRLKEMGVIKDAEIIEPEPLPVHAVGEDHPEPAIEIPPAPVVTAAGPVEPVEPIEPAEPAEPAGEPVSENVVTMTPIPPGAPTIPV